MNINKNYTCWIASLLLVSLSCLTLIGCDGNKSYLTGTVTLDGKPVPGCSLNFESTSDGPGGGGICGPDGHYKAFMSRNNRWLAPGEYKVEITTQADLMASDGDEVEAGAVRIPNKYYGNNTELRMTLKPGNNTVDFELTSD